MGSVLVIFNLTQVYYSTMERLSLEVLYVSVRQVLLELLSSDLSFGDQNLSYSTLLSYTI